MEVRMKKLASNLDIWLMCLPCLLGSSRRRFPLQCLVSQSFFLTKDFVCTSHFACKLIFHMWIQLQIWHLQKANLQTLSLLKVKNCPLTFSTMLTTMLSTCYLCFMRISFWKTAKESHEKSRTLTPVFGWDPSSQSLEQKWAQISCWWHSLIFYGCSQH
jgi:hypothetical protein